MEVQWFPTNFYFLIREMFSLMLQTHVIPRRNKDWYVLCFRLLSLMEDMHQSDSAKLNLYIVGQKVARTFADTDSKYYCLDGVSVILGKESENFYFCC